MLKDCFSTLQTKKEGAVEVRRKGQTAVKFYSRTSPPPSPTLARRHRPRPRLTRRRMRLPEEARPNHLKKQLPHGVRKISLLVGPGPDIPLPPWNRAEEEGEKNQRWAASHRLLCAPENRVQQHQLPGIGHGAGQGGVRIVGGQRHQGGEHDTGRPHPPAGQRVCGMAGTKGQCRSKTSSKFLQEPASHSLVSYVTGSQSEAASGGSGSADAPSPVSLPSVAHTRLEKARGLLRAQHSELWRTQVCTARL